MSDANPKSIPLSDLRAINTLALYFAKKEARAEFKAEGVKTQYLQAWVISAQASQLLAERWEEFRKRAEECLAWSKAQRSSPVITAQFLCRS